MIFGKLLLTFFATTSAMGHYSSLAVRNLNFDLEARQNHRRMVLLTLAKIKRIRNPHRRAVALVKLRKIANRFTYENQPTQAQTQQDSRRNRFQSYHTEN